MSYISDVEPCVESSNFLIHLSKFLSFHFKDGPEYFTNGTSRLFILLIRFLRQSLVRHSFSCFFSFNSFSLMVSASILPSTCIFSYSSSVFIVSVLSVVSLFQVFMSRAYFSVPNYISMSWLPILIISIRFSSFFFIFLQIHLYPPCT